MKQLFTLMIVAATIFAACSNKSDDDEKLGATGTFTDPRDGKTYKTVVMPDGRTWFAENLRYTKGLVWNQWADRANGVTSWSGKSAIGSYWCPTEHGATFTPDQSSLDIYGALYTWETAMMVDGKWADETKTSSAWDEDWESGNSYYGAPGASPAARVNIARGGRGICPPGWHIPTDYEWAVMLDAINGTPCYLPADKEAELVNNVGAKLKATTKYTGPDPGDGSWATNNPSDEYEGYCPWGWFFTDDETISIVPSNNSALDTYGFAARPSGSIVQNSSTYGYCFTDRGTCVSFINPNGQQSNTRMYSLHYCCPQVHRYIDDYRSGADPVRCIQDE
jgi:uncharacterized protein (TIGR02145 family)